jgi:polyisoprenoid-binding protein YceI
MRRHAGLLVAALALCLSAMPAGADTMRFRLLTSYSQASFRSDAPLETFVGTSALEGIEGTLSLDPARPQAASGSVKVDMNRVTTGIEKRDVDMRSKQYLDTQADANRWVTFEVQKVEIAGPLTPGKATPARVHGMLTIKQKAVPKVAEATVMYIKLSPEQLEQQKRFGFTSDNIKVKATLSSTFTEHGMQVPQYLFLKVNNELQMVADLVFVSTQ